MTTKRFAGKVAIVTGASSGGIGAAIALALAKEGAKVVLTGRNEKRLEESKIACETAGAEALVVIAELTNTDALEEIIHKTVERFGGIDILVNNAGGGVIRPIAETDVQDFDRIYETNQRAPWFLSKYALPHLKKSKGCIVNVSSAATTCVPEGIGVIGMTKAALDYFTKAFSSECGPFGVRVNCINPGVVDTLFWGKACSTAEEGHRLRDVMGRRQPLGVVTSEQVADAVVFLCSSPTITGATIIVDGGFSYSK